MARKTYEQTFKDKIIQLHLEEGRTISSLNKEYQLGSGIINNWLKAYRNSCLVDPQKAEEKITQSMSKAGCPYDNAPMESFYGTLKNEYISQHHFKDDESLNNGVYQEIYCWYNHVRPHSFNNGNTPFIKRCG